MTTTHSAQRYLPAPFLVAAHRLAGGLLTTDLTLEVEGPAESSRIVAELFAISFPATWRHGRQHGTARLTITPASSWRSDVSITVSDAPPSVAAQVHVLLDEAVRLVTVERPVPAARPVPVAAVRRSA